MGSVVNRRTHGSQIVGVEFAYKPTVEVNSPSILAPWFEPDFLPDESLSNKATTPVPLDFAIGTYTSGSPSPRVAGWTGALVMASTPVINCLGWNQTKGLMRAFAIVNPQPTLKAPLLGLRRGCRRTDGVRLEFSMPLLMGSIVSGAGAAAEGGHNAQTDPPRTQLGEPGWTGSGTRASLIGMNPPWEAKTTK